MSELLIGEYEHTLDEKHRVSLPKSFRKALGKRLVVVRGFDSCLVIYGEKGWLRFAEKLQTLSNGLSDTRAMSRALFSGAYEMVSDANGRILIPENHCAHAFLERDVVFIGVADRVELWDLGRWKAYTAKMLPEVERIAEGLGGRGVL
jgi:MraZ protein